MERQARRAQVLRHAKVIFARKGYHQTNVSDIISRARIARGTFYLYFENKRDLFQELLDQVLNELATRIWRLRLGPQEPAAADQLRANLRRVLEFVLSERDLSDILLTYSQGFDPDLDRRIQNFYEQIAQKIQRSLDLGIEMGLVRPCDSRTAAYCILGGVKEVIVQLSRQAPPDIGALVEEILHFGLSGVAQPALLQTLEREDGGGRPN
ncbi:MAG TPA: TetR/AcrR family transcriptional regulator [Candidatus Binataceae bacterium]|nr:TetR/AcrR family transcriptional regulator [Candidatus Binataceae bacterium]